MAQATESDADFPRSPARVGRVQRHEIQLGMNDMSLGAKTEPLNMPQQLRREYHARHVASSNRDRARETSQRPQLRLGDAIYLMFQL